MSGVNWATLGLASAGLAGGYVYYIHTFVGERGSEGQQGDEGDQSVRQASERQAEARFGYAHLEEDATLDATLALLVPSEPTMAVSGMIVASATGYLARQSQNINQNAMLDDVRVRVATSGFHTPKAVTYHEPTVMWLFMIGHSLGRIEMGFAIGSQHLGCRVPTKTRLESSIPSREVLNHI